MAPADISKHARRMVHLARVRDGSTGELTNGYWRCEVVGRGAELGILAAHAWKRSKWILGLAEFRVHAVAEGTQHVQAG